MPLIASDSRAISKVPVEILDEILNLATTVKNGDEFGDRSALCATLNHGDMIYNCYVPPEDQKYAFATRRSVVLVCRAWHRIATRFLWSHLIIYPELWTLASFNTIFPSPSELLCSVKRLEIVQSTKSLDRESQKISHTQFKHLLTDKIYPRLSNLRILSAPQNLAIGNSACSPAIVSLHSAPIGLYEGEGWYQWAGGRHFWTSARILNLALDLSVLSDDGLKAGDHILFPQLKKLGIRFAQSDSVIDHIIQYWKTPALEVLSLRDYYTDRCYDLMAWSSDNVTTLELSNVAFEGNTTLPMPHLASIIVVNCFYTGWEDIIEAPSLTKLSFSDSRADSLYQHQRRTFADYLSEMVERYPMCTSVSFFSRKISGTESLCSRSAPSQGDICQLDSDRCKAGANVWLPVFEFDPTNPHARIIAIERQWLSPE